MKRWLVCFVWFCFSMCSYGFPYYVAPEILQEVEQNEALYEQYPTHNDVTFDLAMSYAYSGQILKGWNTLKTLDKSYSADIVVQYESAIQNNAGEWRNHFKLAFGYFFQGEKQRAIDSFHDVLRLEPTQVWALGFIALVYGEMGEVDTAISYCHKALKIEPNATAVHFLLGEGYRKKRMYFKAFKQFLKVGRLQGK